MERVKLSARMRDDMSKSRIKELRRNGFIPANLYGKNVSASLEIKLRDLVEATRTESGSYALIDLEVEGNKDATGSVFIKEVQKDPLTRQVLHVDLQQVSLTEKMTSPIPVEIIGASEGEKVGGILEQVLVEIQVNALPTALPPKIELDATGWEIGHIVRAGDLQLPGDIELITDPDDVVATLRPPHIHAEEPVEEVVAEIETGEEEAPEVE